MSCKCQHDGLIPLEDFRDYAAMFVPKADPELIDHFVRWAAIEFAKRTLMLKRSLWIDLQECVTDYTLCVGDGYKVHSITEVCCENTPLYREDKIDCCPAHGNYYYAADDLTRILIGTQPSCDVKEGLFVRVVVQPTQAACELDSCLYESYGEAIAAGALSRLLLMKDKEFFNLQMAGVFLRRFKGAITQGKVDNSKKGSVSATFIKVPRFI